MKKITVLVALFMCTFTMILSAQNGPAASPGAKVTQTVGTTDITIVYSRPSMKGRAIFGTLVPYGEMWRTGANAATKVSVAKDIKVEGQTLAAGDYALFTTPGKDEWAIHFFAFDQPGANAYGDKTPALTVKVKPIMSTIKIESFMIAFDNLKSDGGDLYLIWDNVVVPIKIGAM